MDLVGKRLDQAMQEISSGASGGALVQLGKGELGDTVDRHEHVELAVLGAHFGDVDVNIADRIVLEPLLRLVALDARQPADAVEPEQPRPAGAGQWRGGGREGQEDGSGK